MSKIREDCMNTKLSMRSILIINATVVLFTASIAFACIVKDGVGTALAIDNAKSNCKNDAINNLRTVHGDAPIKGLEKVLENCGEKGADGYIRCDCTYSIPCTGATDPIGHG